VRSAPRNEVAQVSAEPEAPPPGQFSGVHVAIGVQGGAGPAFVQAWSTAYASNSSRDYVGSTGFSGEATWVPVELRLALLIGRFELALEGSPLGTTVIGSSARSLAPVALSVGGLIKLYERGTVGVYLPLRLRAGVVVDVPNPGYFGGASVGVGARFDRLLFEVKGGAEYLRFGNASAALVPITASAAIAF
jgi:hypothetical protein